MKPATRFFACHVGVALAVAFALAPAVAQQQSSLFNAPVRFIVPYPPGGPTDLTARTFAEKITRTIGQPVVIDNKPGAQGIPAVRQLLQTPADCHAMYFGTLSTQVVSHVINDYRKLPAPYDARKDLVPVSVLGGSPLVIVASKKSGITSYKQLVDTLKAQPGKLNYGSDGIASLTHLGGEMLNQAAGTTSLHIPYKGTAEFSQALLAGDIQFAVSGIVAAVNLSKQDRINVLAIAAPKRSDQLPNVPTTAELGVPGVDLTSWFAVFMREGTPKACVDAMSQAIVKASQDPDVVQRMTAVGIELGMSNTPEQFAKQMDGDFRKWHKVLEQAGIQFEK
ncbi:tripartite tricarboxylate transporter substrate binding protein [Hydrogenophaga sp.]|uniref:Bug family tripartite tricarboxylate transporter substrate binding protein n=1 Tax=Hydrogenophaga sp. TaxID=1904254 RepID=UPI00271C34A2|nr:tripartite tricarboxylate transporter substrate binding protein [Hydrogenophaga sp.]MDO9435349.1 tripartite tricarboxylate transporter substrate binding protein [Hydrogenophaga sp.]